MILGISREDLDTFSPVPFAAKTKIQTLKGGGHQQSGRWLPAPQFLYIYPIAYKLGTAMH